MKGFGKIFVFTFSCQVKNKSYLRGTVIFALLCLLLPPVVMGALEYLGSHNMEKESSEDEIHVSQVFVSGQTEQKISDFSLLTQTGTEEFDRILYTLCSSSGEALKKASEDPYSLILILEQNENSMEYRTLIPKGTSLDRKDAERMNAFWDNSIRAVFLQNAGVDPDSLTELMAPITTETGTAGEQQMSETDAALQNMKEILGYLLPYLNIMVLYFLILLYGQGVAANVIMEKTSKLMDTFLVTVRPTAMIFGKVFAVTAASIMQFVIVLICLAGGVAAGCAVVRAIHPDSDMLLLIFLDSLEPFQGMFTIPGVLLAVVMIISGFLLYCSLSAIGGSAAGKPEDLSSTNVLFTMVLVVSFLAALYAGGIGENGNGSFAGWLDYVPFTSILVTPSRMILGEVSVAAALISLILVLLASAICMLLAGKVYRAMALYKGNPPTPARLVQMLRQNQ